MTRTPIPKEAFPLILLLLLVIPGGAVASASKTVPARRTALTPEEAVLKEIDRRYFHRHEEGNLESSIERLETLLKETPEDPALLWRLCRSLVRMGERKDSKKERKSFYKRAKDLAERSIELDPQEPDGHYWLGVAMGRHGESRGILRSLFMIKPLKREMKAVLELDPRHGGAHHVLGELYRQLPGFAGGSKKKAVAELELAVEVDPDHTTHYPALAEAYLAVGKKKEAAAVLKRVFAVAAPKDPGEYEDNLKDAREMLRELGETPP